MTTLAIERDPGQGPGDRFMTRRQLVEFLNEHGYPLTLSTLNKLAMPSCGEGPPAEGAWGKFDLYDPARGLQWVRSRFRARRRD